MSPLGRKSAPGGCTCCTLHTLHMLHIAQHAHDAHCTSCTATRCTHAEGSAGLQTRERRNWSWAIGPGACVFAARCRSESGGVHTQQHAHGDGTRRVGGPAAPKHYCPGRGSVCSQKAPEPTRRKGLVEGARVQTRSTVVRRCIGRSSRGLRRCTTALEPLQTKRPARINLLETVRKLRGKSCLTRYVGAS